jgi:hypothetical protein
MSQLLLGKVLAPLGLVSSVIALTVGNYHYFFILKQKEKGTFEDLLMMEGAFVAGLLLSVYLFKISWKKS